MAFAGRSEMLQVVEAQKDVDMDALMADLLERVFKRRLRLRERFVEFDPLRTGAVSAHKFRTALTIAGLDHLSDRQYAALAAAFAGPAAGTVQYAALVNHLEQAFVVPDMERHPGATVPPLAAGSVRRPLPALGGAEEAELGALLARIRAQVVGQRLQVKQPFDDFAKGSGLTHRVTRSQFRQVLGMLGVQLTNGEAELLCAKYDSHADRSVNYVEFAVAVDPAVAAALPPALGGSIETATFPSGFRAQKVLSLHEGAYQPGRAPVSQDAPRLPSHELPATSSPEGALDALICRCAEKGLTLRVRLRDSLAAYDKGRSNKMPLPAFRVALSNAFDRLDLELTEAEFVQVAETYSAALADGAPAVRWQDFAAAVDSWTDPPAGFERDPLLVPTARAVCAADKLREPPAGQEHAWEALRDRIRKRASDRSLQLRPVFSDLSRNGPLRLVEHVTRSQLAQGLDALGIATTRAELELLCHRYDTRRDGTFHFVLFASEMDGAEASSQRLSTWNAGVGEGGFHAAKTLPPDRSLPYGTYVQPGRAQPGADVPRLAGTAPPPLDVPSLLRQLTLCAQRDGIRLEPHFADRDRLRTRKLPPAQFRLALRAAFERRYAFSEAQVSALARHYAAQPGAPEGAPGALVRYRDFCDDVNAAARGLEAAPLATPQPVSADVSLPDVSPAELQLVEAVISRVADAVRQRSLSLSPQLRDFERSKRSPLLLGRVSRAQFRQALLTAGLDMTNAEFAAVAKRFDSRRDGSVDFQRFVHRVDPSEAVALSGRAIGSTCGYHHPKVLERAPDGSEAQQPGRAPTGLDQPRLLEKPSGSVHELLGRMRHKCQVLRLQVDGAFRDFDRLNTGSVSLDQFRSALSRAFDTASLALTEKEFAFLVDAFRLRDADEPPPPDLGGAAPARPAPASRRPLPPGVTLIDWRLFSAAVDPVASGMERDPLSVLKPRTTRAPLKTLSPEREEALASLLATIRQRVVSRRVLLKPFFQDFAQSRMKATVADHVTRRQFRQALSTAGVELPAHQMELIYEKFDDSNDLSINYVAFTRAVDPAETYSDRPTEPSQRFTDGYLKPRVVLPTAQQATRIFG